MYFNIPMLLDTGMGRAANLARVNRDPDEMRVLVEMNKGS